MQKHASFRDWRAVAKALILVALTLFLAVPRLEISAGVTVSSGPGIGAQTPNGFQGADESIALYADRGPGEQ